MPMEKLQYAWKHEAHTKYASPLRAVGWADQDHIIPDATFVELECKSNIHLVLAR
jgi:hypothetical protein